MTNVIPLLSPEFQKLFDMTCDFHDSTVSSVEVRKDEMEIIFSRLYFQDQKKYNANNTSGGKMVFNGLNGEPDLSGLQNDWFYVLSFAMDRSEGTVRIWTAEKELIIHCDLESSYFEWQ